MSKRAEKAAWDWAVENKLDPYSMGQAYAEGFKKAEKETIERAVIWLKENVSQHIMGVGIGLHEPMDYFVPDFVWEDFKKAMVEEL